MVTHSPKIPQSSAKTQTPSPLVPGQVSESRLLELQRTIGNRATARLLSGSDTIQTARKKKKKKGKKGKKGKGHKKQKMAQVVQEAEKSGGLLQWLASFVPGATYEAPKEDDDDDDGDDSLVSYQDIEGEKDEDGLLKGYEEEFGEEEEDEEEDNSEQLENPFAIKFLEINLQEAKGETDTRMGKAKGSSKTSMSEEGFKVSSEGSVEGRYGKAQGNFESDGQKHEGKGNVELLLGASHEKKSGTVGWEIAGQEVAGNGQMESKVGLSGQMAAKMLYDSLSGDMKAKGKAGAFLGASSEGKVTVKLKSNGQDLGTVEGKLGLSVGLGGEIGGGITWQGGTLEFSSHGKLVAGLGFSYGYKFKVNTTALAQGWGSWMMSKVKFW